MVRSGIERKAAQAGRRPRSPNIRVAVVTFDGFIALTPMSIPLLIAAALAVILGIGHSYLGERYILGRLFRRGNLSELFREPEQTKGIVRLAWHVMSVFALGFAAMLLLLASSRATEPRAMLVIVSATFAVNGVASLILTRARHVSWVIFVAIAALTWLAAS